MFLALVQALYALTCNQAVAGGVAGLAKPQGEILGLVQPLSIYLLQQGEVFYPKVCRIKLVHIKILERRDSTFDDMLKKTVVRSLREDRQLSTVS